MIKQIFRKPAQGAQVQKSIQTKGGITVIADKETITVIVQSVKEQNLFASNDFRKGVEL